MARFDSNGEYLLLQGELDVHVAGGFDFRHDVADVGVDERESAVVALRILEQRVVLVDAAVEAEGHGGGVERGAVVELDALAQVEDDGQAVG